MGRRLDLERQKELEPKRVESTKRALETLGYEVEQIGESKLIFFHLNSCIQFFPYSGWFSGKGIKDGRGFKNLLKQLKSIK